MPAFCLAKCAAVVDLAEPSSEGGAVVPASVVFISGLVPGLALLFCTSLCGGDCLVQKDGC